MGKEKYCFFAIFTIVTARSTNILFPDSGLSTIAAAGSVQHDDSPSSVLSSQSACGMSSAVTRDRVVGGVPSTLGAWPWIAAIGYARQNEENGNDEPSWKCAGTLITQRHVITAAHCLVDLPNGLIPRVVRLGDLDLDPRVADGATPLDVPIDRVIVHSRYLYDEKLINDIALLKLTENVIFTVFVRPICLPNTSEEDYTNLRRRVVTVAGWGSVHSDTLHNQSDSHNTKLMEVELPVTDPEQCRKAYVNDNNVVIGDSVICAGNPYGGDDSCRGDSGGPLMMSKGKQYYLMGIISYGPSVCGARGIPGVYTRVSSFIHWIDEKIHQNRNFIIWNV